jgi:hypothetical protein
MSPNTIPHIDENGILVVPGECSDNTLKWWKSEGKSIEELLRELGASPEVWAGYTDKPYPDERSSADNPEDSE